MRVADESDRMSVAKELYAAFERGDLETIYGLLDENVLWEMLGPSELPHSGTYRGVEEVRRFFEILLEHTVVERIEMNRFTETSDGVIVEGFERGSFRGHPASYDMRWCHVMTIDDGRITRFTDYHDTAPMVEAIRS